MPRAIYEKFVKEYNEKQWGVPATRLSRELCTRFNVRADDDPRLKPDAKYQGLPKEGYAELMRRMLEGISVMLNVDYLQRRDEFTARKLLVFTGPVDEYFGYDLGRLHYRALQRSHTLAASAKNSAQPFAQSECADAQPGPAHPHAGMEAHDAAGKYRTHSRHGADQRNPLYAGKSG